MRSSSNCTCFSKTKYKTTEHSSLNLSQNNIVANEEILRFMLQFES